MQTGLNEGDGIIEDLEARARGGAKAFRLGVSYDRFTAIFGEPAFDRGKTTYESAEVEESKRRIAEASRRYRERHIEVFGVPQPVRRGVYRINPATGAVTHWDDFTDSGRAEWLRRQRTKSTRMNIISDIEPFQTGVTEFGEVIGSRHEKREYMKRTGLVEFEQIDEAVDKGPDPDEIARDILRAWETDPLNRPPKDYDRALAEKDEFGVAMDLDNVETIT